MNNEKMIKFSQIRSSYARKRFGTLNNDEKALIDYETFCLELIRESDELQQRLDKAIEYIKHSWWLRLDQVYDTSKDLKGWEVEQLLEILEGEDSSFDNPLMGVPTFLDKTEEILKGDDK